MSPCRVCSFGSEIIFLSKSSAVRVRQFTLQIISFLIWNLVQMWGTNLGFPSAQLFQLDILRVQGSACRQLDFILARFSSSHWRLSLEGLIFFLKLVSYLYFTVFDILSSARYRIKVQIYLRARMKSVSSQERWVWCSEWQRWLCYFQVSHVEDRDFWVLSDLTLIAEKDLDSRLGFPLPRRLEGLPLF